MDMKTEKELRKEKASINNLPEPYEHQIEERLLAACLLRFNSRYMR